jgi:hypothetical protein
MLCRVKASVERDQLLGRFLMLDVHRKCGVCRRQRPGGLTLEDFEIL